MVYLKNYFRAFWKVGENWSCSMFGSGGCAPSGVEGQSPWWGFMRISAPEADEILAIYTVILH